MVYPNGDPRGAASNGNGTQNGSAQTSLPGRPAGKKSLILNAFIESCTEDTCNDATI